MVDSVTYPFIGKKEVIIGNELFPPELVQDDGATVTITPSTTDVSSQSGTISVPNGAYDEISASVNIIINSVATLMKIFPNLSKAASFGNGATGQVHFGASTCQTTTPVPVIIRNVCDDGSSQDVRIPQALIQAGGEFDISQGDPTVLEVDITPLPSTEGYVVFGEGDLEQKSKWDVTSGQYKPVETSPAPTKSIAPPRSSDANKN